MINGPENIQSIFNIFHDGSIAAGELTDGTLRLSIDIQYLAERIHADYTSFEVTLHGVAGLSFTPWTDGESAPIDDPDQILALDLEILSCNRDGERLTILCSQHSSVGPGGELALAAGSASVADEGNREYSLAELAALATAYWEALQAATQRRSV
jgi:hypothetical protein